MPLADLSIDDAIAMACREVPECCPRDPFVFDHWLGRWRHKDGGETPGHGGGTPIPLEPETFRAVWFHSATIWFLTTTERTGDPILVGHSTFNLRLAEDGGWYISPSVGTMWFNRRGPFPSEFHALVAAVLLISGRVVP